MSDASFAASVNRSTDGSLMEVFSVNDTFFGILQNYLLNVSASSLSLDNIPPLQNKFIVSSWFILSEKTGLTVCQKKLSSVM